MNLEEWKQLSSKLEPYYATTVDQKSVLISPRTLGANHDKITPLYWDLKFFLLLETGLAYPSKYINEANFIPQPRQYREGKVTKYIVDGLLGANGIEVPRQFKDRLFLLALFPQLVGQNPPGELLTYFLDDDLRTEKEKLASTRNVVRSKIRGDRFRW